MAIRKKLQSLVLLVSLILLGDFSNSVWSQSYSQLELDANRILWTRLLYQSKSIMVDMTTNVVLESLSADEVKAALIANQEGVAVQIPGTGGYKLASNTIIDSIFQPPVKITNQVWFDPRNATALGRMRLRRGEDDFKKIYRFTQQGVFRHRREPKDQQEAQQDPEKWTDVLDTFYPYNLAQLGCANVSERLLLIYIASTVEQLENNKPLFLCIFGKRQLFQVQLKSAGIHSVKIDYIEKKLQATHHRQGEVKAHKILLEAQPLESNLEKVENFSFLGFRKNIAFFIDPTSKLPIQISGEIPKAGSVTLKLHEVQLR